MPDIHGIEVLKEIRKIDREAAVMVLTNWGTDYLEQLALAVHLGLQIKKR